jgi:DNA/RNA non-specific endonuclease
VAAILALLCAPGSSRAQSNGIALPLHDDRLLRASCLPPRQLLDRSFYHICYEPGARIPAWVGYDLTPTLLEGTITRSDDFRPDPDLPLSERAELLEYEGSGFDRGHMAPAETFKLRRRLPARSSAFSGHTSGGARARRASMGGLLIAHLRAYSRRGEVDSSLSRGLDIKKKTRS